MFKKAIHMCHSLINWRGHPDFAGKGAECHFEVVNCEGHHSPYLVPHCSHHELYRFGTSDILVLVLPRQPTPMYLKQNRYILHVAYVAILAFFCIVWHSATAIQKQETSANADKPARCHISETFAFQLHVYDDLETGLRVGVTQSSKVPLFGRSRMVTYSTYIANTAVSHTV